MSRKRRRRRSTPTPAQIWRIFHVAAREARLAKRERAALLSRLDLELAAQRERLEEEAAAQRKRLDEEAATQRKRLDEELAAQRRKHEAEAAARKRAMAEQAEEFRKADEKRRRERAERDREQAERDRALDRRLNQLSGYADNRWGRLAEGLVEEDLVRLLAEAGVEVSQVAHRVRSHTREEYREYDLVAFGERDAVVVEVKATLERPDVTQFAKRLRDFREWRPDYALPRVLGAMACLAADRNAFRAAESAGFYVIRALDSTARIVNSEGFQPAIY